LMLLATIGILPAAVARIPLDFFRQGGPLVFFGMTDLLILPCLLFDIVTRGRPHRATVLGGLLLVISHPLRLIIGNTSVWLAFELDYAMELGLELRAGLSEQGGKHGRQPKSKAGHRSTGSQ
jgi:hypothetical protein